MNEKEKIGYIQATRLIDFEEHLFVVEENTAFIELMDSIRSDLHLDSLQTFPPKSLHHGARSPP